MNSGSLVYKKGDLVTIKQNIVMLCYGGNNDRHFTYSKNLKDGIFLGIAKEEDAFKEAHEYCVKYTPIKNPCVIAVGNTLWYVDETSFHFYNNRRNNEKVNRSYAE
tara:strand:+ start:1218 stop:1535 length:318 start_codon:yes stop_codon:yes gene_type:complete